MIRTVVLLLHYRGTNRCGALWWGITSIVVIPVHTSAFHPSHPKEPEAIPGRSSNSGCFPLYP
jgi:hypothetical protein